MHRLTCTLMHAHTNPVFQRAQLPELHRWRTATWRADPDSPPRRTHYTHKQIYRVYDTPKNRHVQYTLKKRERETPTDRIGPKTETAEPYCTDVYYSLKTNGIHHGTWSGITPYVLGLEKQVSFWRLDPTLMSHKNACHRVLACLSSW